MESLAGSSVESDANSLQIANIRVVYAHSTLREGRGGMFQQWAASPEQTNKILQASLLLQPGERSIHEWVSQIQIRLQSETLGSQWERLGTLTLMPSAPINFQTALWYFELQLIWRRGRERRDRVGKSNSLSVARVSECATGSSMANKWELMTLQIANNYRPLCGFDYKPVHT